LRASVVSEFCVEGILAAVLGPARHLLRKDSALKKTQHALTPCAAVDDKHKGRRSSAVLLAMGGAFLMLASLQTVEKPVSTLGSSP
jgi:hypothetical protein